MRSAVRNTGYVAPCLVIDGELLGREGRDVSQIIDPTSGSVLSYLPHASAADLDQSLASSARAFPHWKGTPVAERSKVLRKAAEFIRQRADLIALHITLEQGKPLAEARQEVFATAENFEWFAEEGRRAYGRIVPGRASVTKHFIVREPIGPVAAFSPWNFPAVLSGRKIAAALAAGCTCIIKPPEEAPSATVALAVALRDAGLPNGVLNVVFGDPEAISKHLIASNVVRKVAFTGSTAVGRKLAHLAADGVKPITLELGGHAPVIVFEDADLERTVQIALSLKFRNAGQVCVSPTRFIVHESVHRRFLDLAKVHMDSIQVGDPLELETSMGPLANPRRRHAISRFVDEADQAGAKVLQGGEKDGAQGNFWMPTLLANVPLSASIMNEEPFGPVVATTTFQSLDEAVVEANRLPYGLAAYVFTRSLSTAMTLYDAVESGMVSVNGGAILLPELPFGGVKESGYGSEGGIEGLEAYMHTKSVSLG